MATSVIHNNHNTKHNNVSSNHRWVLTTTLTTQEHQMNVKQQNVKVTNKQMSGGQTHMRTNLMLIKAHIVC